MYASIPNTEKWTGGVMENMLLNGCSSLAISTPQEPPPSTARSTYHWAYCSIPQRTDTSQLQKVCLAGPPRQSDDTRSIRATPAPTLQEHALLSNRSLEKFKPRWNLLGTQKLNRLVHIMHPGCLLTTSQTSFLLFQLLIKMSLRQPLKICYCFSEALHIQTYWHV